MLVSASHPAFLLCSCLTGKSWTQNKFNFNLYFVLKGLLIGSFKLSHLWSPSNWLLDFAASLSWGVKLELSAHLEGDVIKLSAVAQGRSAGINQSGGRSGGSGQTFPRPPALSAAARRRLGAPGAPFAFHCLLPGHGSDKPVQLRAIKMKVWHARDWVPFRLPALFFSLVEFWLRRKKFTRASKSWLCVKRKLVTVSRSNKTKQKLDVKRGSCCPGGAAGWLWIWGLVHNVNGSVSSLSRIVMLGAREGMVVSVRFEGNPP